MKEFTFIFTEQEINYVLSILARQPFGEVADVIFSIRQQAEEAAP